MVSLQAVYKYEPLPVTLWRTAAVSAVSLQAVYKYGPLPVARWRTAAVNAVSLQAVYKYEPLPVSLWRATAGGRTRGRSREVHAASLGADDQNHITLDVCRLELSSPGPRCGSLRDYICHASNFAISLPRLDFLCLPRTSRLMSGFSVHLLQCCVGCTKWDVGYDLQFATRKQGRCGHMGFLGVVQHFVSIVSIKCLFKLSIKLTSYFEIIAIRNDIIIMYLPMSINQKSVNERT